MSCEIEAKVLCYSVGEDAPPLPTFQLRYPLQIHAELMTHRVFSRNARSSRAVPTARLLDEVRERPFIPRYWGANQKGMQASAECSEPVSIPLTKYSTAVVDRERAWLLACVHAVELAEAFANAGYHKQIANRLLAPFLHIDVVLTATELSNWFALRDDKAAEPHIRDLAVMMREALEAFGSSTPLREGQWHLPYVDAQIEDDGDQSYRMHLGAGALNGVQFVDMPVARAVSVTRCAQVSYTPFHEAKLTVAEEVARHDTLITNRPMHASPCEHQATPDTRLPDGSWANPHLHGNLRGWIQYRKTLAGECA